MRPLNTPLLKRAAATVSAAAVAVSIATGSVGSANAGDAAVLQRFAPQSSSTWWAVVGSNVKPETFLARTTDGGRRWRTISLPVRLVSSTAFLGGTDAWIEGGALFPSRTAALYRTLDGGRSWQRVGNVPSDCQLDFVDGRHGWCTAIGAATGSETVRLYRTVDGGVTWRLASRTGLYDAGSTPGALPFRCDKTLAFTSPRSGWAASYCAGGAPYLYVTRDGGTRWRPVAEVPLPRGLPTPPAGEGLSVPAVAGSELVVSVAIGGAPRGATAIAASANGGGSWRTRLVPGALRYWQADLVDVRHWRLTDGSTLLATDDAGRHWRSLKSPVRLRDAVGATLALDFLSPRIGFAVPQANRGPLWWTRDGGTSWKPLEVAAGPFAVP